MPRSPKLCHWPPSYQAVTSHQDLGQLTIPEGGPVQMSLRNASLLLSTSTFLCLFLQAQIVFEGPVLGPAKDRDWTGPGPERTAKLKDRKRPDRVKTAKDRCEPDQLRPVETSLWYCFNLPSKCAKNHIIWTKTDRDIGKTVK